MSLASVIDTAMSQVGISEYPPNSNKCKYNTEYYGYEVGGDAYPWCVTFLWWVFKHSGEQNAFYGGNKTASSTQLMNYYQNNGRFITNGYQVGDIVFFNFTGGSGADHVEIIVEKGSSSGLFVTVGGNTTPGNEGSQYNGGTVARKTRYSSQFLGGGRPAYSSVPSYDYYNPNLNPMEQGTISTSGNNSSSSNFIRTNGYVSFPYEGRIVINSNLARGNIFFYNSSYSRISYSSLGNLPLSYIIPEGTEYIRIVLGKSSGATAPEDFEYLSINVNANSQVPFSKIIKATAKVLAMHSIVPDSVAIFPKKDTSFRFTIKVPGVEGTSPAYSLRLTINRTSQDQKTRIYWGDGSYKDCLWSGTATESHTYSDNGIYQIKIEGFFSDIWPYNASGSSRIDRVLLSIDTPFPETMQNRKYAIYLFYRSLVLQKVPNDLFVNCTSINNFSYAFENCTELERAPDLWNQFPNATGTRCFRGCSNASNYSSIPSDWK